MPRRDDREFEIFCGREPSKEEPPKCARSAATRARDPILVILPYAVDCGQLRYPWS
jgi:hypothetical protein